MTKKRSLLALVLLVTLALTGCQGIQRFLHKKLTDTPAPTAVPLPSPAPSPSARTIASSETPTPTTVPLPSPTPSTSAQPIISSETLALTPTLETATSTPAESPTRVVPPTETVNLPPSFGISVFTQHLRDPRMMTLSPDGQIYGRAWCRTHRVPA